ncbi:AI-2E family transporter [Flaviaesturariibacter aridisoli]|uniref:AI-2E family transporter n=1 Tax=Flaviaesturariibacter aridisoli TaxID=2545761 RepID=A0A4R4E5N5_9BACT|nr:AI-2E family transporter [Flaviaesturariibacter aridisoli]TCZ74956.1 AI-2E family transporter [Flaviaesturariibacter aridisoli]
MEKREYPFYIKVTAILLGLVLTTYILKGLGDILTPLAFAVIIAILLNPLVNKLAKFRLGKIPAIILAMLLAILVFAGIFYFLSSQIMGFGENLPALKAKFGGLTSKLQVWMQQKFGLSLQKQANLINEAANNSKALIGGTLTTVIGTLGVLLLLPVYVFLFLFYKTLILNFLFKVFAEDDASKVGEILGETKLAIQSYMVGLLLEAAIVAAMNSTALLLIGVKYALLLGVLGALLNMLPYIGGLIAIGLPVLMVTVTSEGFSKQLWIVLAYLFIQFIDNNVLVPRIVSSKVNINALISVVVVLLGGALWGIAGMFLSIPFVGILKIIFDRVEGLKPWGELLGVEVPTSYNRFSFRKKNDTSVAEKVVKKSVD